MRGFWGAVTLILGGIILADLVANPEGVKAGGGALNSVLTTTFGAMLGTVGQGQQKPK